MKKIMILCGLFCFAFETLKAQEYPDLMNLWVDKKYEKLVDKAYRYTEKDKSKNDPLPYLYLAKGLFKISQDEKLREKEQYKKSESEALKYAATFKKKDKNGTYRSDQATKEFFSEMKTHYFEQTQNWMEKKDFKKALAIMKKVVIFDEQNPSVWLIKGVCEFELKNKPEAQKNVSQGIDGVKKIQDFNDWYECDKDFLRFALMEYATYLKANKDLANAKMVINLGYQYFSDVKTDDEELNKKNKAYVEKYNELVNG